MYKIVNNIAPALMKSIFPLREISYNLRTKNPFQQRNITSVYNGTESLSFRGVKTWSIVPEEIKNSATLKDFKAKIMLWEPLNCSCRLCKTYVADLGFVD